MFVVNVVIIIDLIVVEIKAKMADLAAVFNLAKMKDSVIVIIMDYSCGNCGKNGEFGGIIQFCKNKRFSGCG